MIGTLFGSPIFDGPRVAIVVATHDVDAAVPSGSVRVSPLAPNGDGLTPIPRTVPCLSSPPGDGSEAFVPSFAWVAP